MHGRGLLGRFLYALPLNSMGRRDPNPPGIPAAVLSEYDTNIRWLLNRKAINELLPFSPDALLHWLAFAEWLEHQLLPEGELGNMTEWAGKLAGHVARIAGLLHIASHIGETTMPSVGAASVDSAIAIGHYLIAHAKAAFHLMHLDERVADAEHALQWVRAHAQSSFRLRDLYQALKGNRRFRTMAKLRPAIELLVEHHYIREQQCLEHRGRGRKPSPVYEVNPLIRSNGVCGNSSERERLTLVAGGGESCVM